MAVWGAGGRSRGSVLVRSFQEIHGGHPAGAPALLRVHVGEGGPLRRGGALLQGGEALQLLGEGRATPGSGCRSAALRRRRRRWALPEQHHSTAALIGNMVSTCSPNVWAGGGSGDKRRSLPPSLPPTRSLTFHLLVLGRVHWCFYHCSMSLFTECSF